MPVGGEKKVIDNQRQLPSETLILIRKQREKIKLLSENGNSIKHRHKIVALRIKMWILVGVCRHGLCWEKLT